MSLLAPHVDERRRKIDSDDRGAMAWTSRQYDWRFLLPHLPQGEELSTSSRVASIPAIQVNSGSQMYMKIDCPAITLPPYLLKRRLARLGIRDVTFYWSKRGVAGVEMLMPLGDRRLQNYYLRRLYFGTSPLKKALRVTFRLLSMLGIFELALPRYVAIARRGDNATSDSDSTTPHLLRILLSKWSALETGQPRPRKLQWVMLNGGVNVHSKIVCPLWLNTDPEPAFVMKFQRDSRYNTHLVTEYQALANLQRYLPPGQLRVPRPCGSLFLDGMVVTLESALRGKSLALYVAEHPKSYASTLKEWEALATWLARLHLNSARPATDKEINALLLEPLRTANHDLSLSLQESIAVSDLYSMALRLSEKCPLPLVYNHNDFGPPNVLATDSGRFGRVIDWESGGFGLPATDLIYFLGRYAYVARSEGRDNELRGFKEMFFDVGTPLSSHIAKEWLGDYCRRLEISTLWLPVLFALCWLMHARNEQEQLEQKRQQIEERTGRTSEPLLQTSGHFRTCLRFYLENMDRLAISHSQAEIRTP